MVLETLAGKLGRNANDSWSDCGRFVSRLDAAAHGALVAFDSFNYPVGDLNGQNGGIGFSDAWQNGGTVVAGSLGLGSYQGTGNSLSLNGYRDLATTYGADGTQLWASFLMQPTLDNGGTIGGMLLWGGPSLGLYVGVPASLTSPDINPYGMDTIGGNGQVFSNVPVVFGQTTLLVVHMTFQSGNDHIDLYVNPTTSTVPATPDATKTDLDLSLTAVQFLSGFPTTFDEFRLGTTYADVIGLAVPEPSSQILCSLGAIGLVLAACRSRQV